MSERLDISSRRSSSISGVERRGARLLSDAVIGIGREVFADFEDGFELAVRAQAARDLRGSQRMAFLVREVVQDFSLERNHGGRGFLAGLDAGLMIRIDIDQAGVK